MPSDLEMKVSQIIRLQGMFADAEGILVAVSGGADSVSLLHVLKSLHVQGALVGRLVCGHVNHQLRGRASDADERFVVKQAAGLGLPIFVKTVDVRSHAEANRLSIETSARQLRLAALGEIAHEQGCCWIATGHQKNDNAETVLHRLRRGTGFRGLGGIRPVRKLTEDLWLASPLLCATRDEIARYLRERNLLWREDRSNADVAYTRNYIRHRLFPSLQQESSRPLVEDLSQLALSAGRLYDRVQQEVERTWPQTVQGEADEVRIEASRLASLPGMIAVEWVRRALVHLGCGERDLTEGHYQRVLRLAQPGPGAKAVSLPDGFIAQLDRSRIILHKSDGMLQPLIAQDRESVLTIPGQTQFAGYAIDANVLDRDEIDLTEVTADKGPFCEHLDWDRISPPVIVRPRRPGDRFQPLGLDATAKVGKFLTTAKAPRDVREHTLIFADRESILWVCPFRIAEPAKIADTTQRILRLTVTDHPPGLRPRGCRPRERR